MVRKNFAEENAAFFGENLECRRKHIVNSVFVRDFPQTLYRVQIRAIGWQEVQFRAPNKTYFRALRQMMDAAIVKKA